MQRSQTRLRRVENQHAAHQLYSKAAADTTAMTENIGDEALHSGVPILTSLSRLSTFAQERRRYESRACQVVLRAEPSRVCKSDDLTRPAFCPLVYYAYVSRRTTQKTNKQPRRNHSLAPSRGNRHGSSCCSPALIIRDAAADHVGM